MRGSIPDWEENICASTGSVCRKLAAAAIVGPPASENAGQAHAASNKLASTTEMERDFIAVQYSDWSFQ